MQFCVRILRGDEPLVDVRVDTAFDATSIEAANRMKFALEEAIPGDVAHEEHDQFLIGTAAHDWIRSVWRPVKTGNRLEATIPLSQGRPCRTVTHPAEHVDLVPGECHVRLLACPEEPNAEPRPSTRSIIGLPFTSIRKAA